MLETMIHITWRGSATITTGYFKVGLFFDLQTQGAAGRKMSERARVRAGSTMASLRNCVPTQLYAGPRDSRIRLLYPLRRGAETQDGHAPRRRTA
jgi:hypothetical protein